MLDPIGRRFLISETQVTWSCLPSPAHARWILGWGMGFIVVAGIALPAGIWFIFSQTPMPGLGIAAILADWVLFGIFGYVIHEIWQERKTLLIADAIKGTLSFGPACLCQLDEIEEITPKDDNSADEPSFSLVVHLKDGRTTNLPSWFVALPFDDAETVCRSLNSF